MKKELGRNLIVDEIEELISDATAIIVVDYQYLTVEQDLQLRKMLKEAGCKYKVYKVSFIAYAIRETVFEPMIPYLEGPCGLLTAYKESEPPEKVLHRLYQYSRKLRIRCGMIDGILYDDSTMKAKIKDDIDREKLQLRLLGNLAMPFIRLEYALKQALKQKCQESGVDLEELESSVQDTKTTACDMETQEINPGMDVQDEHMYERIEQSYADGEFITDNKEPENIYKSEVELITEEAQRRANEYKRHPVRDIIVLILILALAIGFAIYSGMDMLNALP